MGAFVGASGGRSLFLMQRSSASVFYHRGISSVLSTPQRGPLDCCLSPEPANVCQRFPELAMPWGRQQFRAKARGNEYQPSNLKRKHKHGWIRRIRSASGIEVILRRLLKGRKSLTH